MIAAAPEWVAQAREMRAKGLSFHTIGFSLTKSPETIRRTLQPKRDRRAEEERRRAGPVRTRAAELTAERKPRVIRQVYDRSAVAEFLAGKITRPQMLARIRA